jgi:hypothetical protein
VLFDIVSAASKAASGATQPPGRALRSNRTTRYNADPTQTERRIAFTQTDETKTFIVRGLIRF